MGFLVGIDPGKAGGFAIIDQTSRTLVDGGPLDFQGCDRRLYDALKFWGCPDVLLERAQAASGDAGQFEYGRGFGRTETAVELSGSKRFYVSPSWWKGKLGCPVDKTGAYRLAEKFFPNLGLFAHNGPRGGLDTGTAEAALIAYAFAKLRPEIEKNNAASVARAASKRRRVRYAL